MAVSVFPIRTVSAKDVDCKVICSEFNDSGEYEVSKIGNTTYIFFRDELTTGVLSYNDDYDITELCIKDNRSPDKLLYSNEFDASALNNYRDLIQEFDYSSISVKNIETIKSLAYKIGLDEIDISDNIVRYNEKNNEIVDYSKTDVSVRSEADDVIQTAIDEYGGYVWDQYLTQGHYSGVTEKLYYTRTFGEERDFDYGFAAGVAVSVISVAVGWSPSVIKNIISVVLGAGGIWLAANADTVKNYTVTVYNQKEVKVNSVYPYRSLKDVHGRVATASVGTSEFSYTSTTYNDNLYNNNQSIIRRGCELY